MSQGSNQAPYFQIYVAMNLGLALNAAVVNKHMFVYIAKTTNWWTVLNNRLISSTGINVMHVQLRHVDLIP